MIKSIILLSALVVISNCEPTERFANRYLLPKEYNYVNNHTNCFKATDGDSIFRYSIDNLNSSLGEIKFEKFRGKVILLLNVATFCHSTIDYPQLNQLKEKFGDDLVIVGFPCSQFLNQEPGSTADEIFNSIRYVRPGKGFVPKFMLTKKIEVNGANTHPIFSFLKRSCPSTELSFTDQKLYFWDPKNVRDVKWNFEKFLINGRDGQVIKRYDTSLNPIKISNDIEKLIKNI